jgi:hypothetical protein
MVLEPSTRFNPSQSYINFAACNNSHLPYCLLDTDMAQVRSRDSHAVGEILNHIA